MVLLNIWNADGEFDCIHVDLDCDNETVPEYSPTGQPLAGDLNERTWTVYVPLQSSRPFASLWDYSGRFKSLMVDMVGDEQLLNTSLSRNLSLARAERADTFDHGLCREGAEDTSICARQLEVILRDQDDIDHLQEWEGGTAGTLELRFYKSMKKDVESPEGIKPPWSDFSCEERPMPKIYEFIPPTLSIATLGDRKIKFENRKMKYKATRRRPHHHIATIRNIYKSQGTMIDQN
jgi:hypothetical protein